MLWIRIQYNFAAAKTKSKMLSLPDYILYILDTLINY